MVHCHQQVRLQRFQGRDQRRGQAVAMHLPVGDSEVDMACTKQAQATHRDRTGGGAIAVEIGGDHDPPIRGDGVAQQSGGGIESKHAGRWQQRCKPRLRGILPAAAACGMRAPQGLRPVRGPLAHGIDRRSTNDATRRVHATNAPSGERQNRQR